ncbi:hypothetical protein DNH61_17040 [Paenibacillus sambharensis]|uniref:EfeO-type cupredoxin-like domain-containing protein n=1 Tax=Paenibacillus sambharensis TaxID=1803190 RepID=A0A2W1L3S4_9BACL|nr:cupredoxin domain-containing protein [Paenibacillus sambharensis]PZD94658.1 hypothetical protein DNH61_17040 [Paenibacillus sambharensis]
MSKILVVSRKQIRLAAVLAIAVVLAAAYLRWDQSEAANSVPAGEKVFHLVTEEVKSTDPHGKEVDVYRWDPGTLVVHQGEQVRLEITGLKGESHPFIIEGLGIRGEVLKGQTTTVTFTADKKGSYPILCLTHTSEHQSSPMVAYLTVI